MKNITKYNKRLLLFADWLNSCKGKDEPNIQGAWIQWEEDHAEIWYVVSFNMDYFLELPSVFKEWSNYGPANEVEIKWWPKYLGMVGMIRKFFWLHPKEFTHLFDTEGRFQNIEKYGGAVLNRNSSPQEIANNIIEFVERRKNKYQAKLDLSRK
jgi:hypothetical protein